MGLKQLKRIKNTKKLEKYDTGTTDYGWNYWNTPKQSYQGANGWDWGTSKFNTQTNNPQLSFTPVNFSQPVAGATEGLSSAAKAANTAGAAMNIGASALNFGGSVFSSFGGVQSTQQLQNDAGYGHGSIGGINYTTYNNIDKNKEMSDLSTSNTSNTLGSTTSGMALGASIGSLAGPVGGVIGAGVGAIAGFATGLFGGASRKRKLRRRIYEAQQLTDRTNQFNRSDADTQGLQQTYAQQYGDSDNQLLYANNGKDTNNDFEKKHIFLRQPR